MISRKELGYVNTHARQVPFPGVNYASKAIDELIKVHNLYEELYVNNDFGLTLSNGEEIELCLLNKNLAHMLGIDFKNLTSLEMADTVRKVLGFEPDEYRSSYDMLTRIIERADEVIKNDANSDRFKILNYYKTMIKCAIFSQLPSFDKVDFGCINFDREIYNEVAENDILSQSTKFLFTQSDQIVTPYFMIGIKYSSSLKKFILETLLAPENFADFFVRQELVIPTQVVISNNNELSIKQVTAKEKLDLLNMYKFIINTYKTNSFINIFSDYENMLMTKQRKVKEKSLF